MSLFTLAERAIFGSPKDANHKPEMQLVNDLFFGIGEVVATVAALKALTPIAGNSAYLTANWRAGMFVFRAGNYTSLTTLDTANGIYIKANTIAASAGAWVRDRSAEEFRPEWFVDDLSATGAMNAAFALINPLVLRPSKITIPAGFYNLNAAIIPYPNMQIIEGAGPNVTVLYFATALQSTVIDGSAVGEGFEVRNLAIYCGDNTNYGILHQACTHATFSDLLIIGSKLAGIRADNGYCVRYDRVRMFSNAGEGIDHRGVNNNQVTFNECAIYANSGFGVKIANGSAVTFNNCVIEANAKGGVAAYDVMGLRFNGGYFERNASAGYAFTTGDGSPENLTVKADILLLSNSMTINQTTGKSCSGVSLDSVSFTPYGYGNVPTAGLSQDCHVFAIGADDLSITNCDPWDSSKSAMVGLFNNGFKAKTNSIVIDGATSADSAITFLGTGLTSFAYSSGHNIRKPMEQHNANYASSNIYDWGVASGTTGTLLKSSVSVNGFDAWQIAAGDRLYTFTIDVARFPELRGKWVVHSIMYRVGDTGSNLQIWNGGHTDNDGSITEIATAAGVWVTKSVVRLIGAGDTTLVIGAKRTGTGSNPITLHPPALTVLGVDLAATLQAFKVPVYAKSAIPAEGAWRVGERVFRNPPVVAQPKSWVNTVAGSPGTFMSEGNL